MIAAPAFTDRDQRADDARQFSDGGGSATGDYNLSRVIVGVTFISGFMLAHDGDPPLRELHRAGAA
jgi:hypothetical protein